MKTIDLHAMGKKLLNMFHLRERNSNYKADNFAPLFLDIFKKGVMNHCELSVYAVIVRASNESGYCFWSQQKIADTIDYERTVVNRAIKKLIDKGFIVRLKERKENNQELAVYAPTYTLKRTAGSKSEQVTAVLTKKSGPFAVKSQSGPDLLVNPALTKRSQEEKPSGEKPFEDLTTRGEKEAEASTEVEGVNINTIDLDESIISAYKQEVDPDYIEQPADVKYVHSFKNKEQLLKYIPYWNKYIGHHPDMQWRLNTLDDYDKKHSAKICVMVKHWNKFKKFAEGQILKEERLAEGLV
jgi:predicted transcriptional regulator